MVTRDSRASSITAEDWRWNGEDGLLSLSRTVAASGQPPDDRQLRQEDKHLLSVLSAISRIFSASSPPPASPHMQMLDSLQNNTALSPSSPSLLPPLHVKADDDERASNSSGSGSGSSMSDAMLSTMLSPTLSSSSSCSDASSFSHTSAYASSSSCSSSSSSSSSLGLPVTPRSASTPRRSSPSVRRYASRDSLLYSPRGAASPSSFSSASVSSLSGTDRESGGNDYDSNDRYTQIPRVSPRERRSSSATLVSAAGTSARRRKSLATLAASSHGTPASTESYGTPATVSGKAGRKHSLGGGSSFGTPSLNSLLAGAASGLMPPHMPSEGKRLSRRPIEASRRSAKEALEEDLRALDLVGAAAAGIRNGSPTPLNTSTGEDYACECRVRPMLLQKALAEMSPHAVDCYMSSLDYLVKAVKVDTQNSEDDKTRRAIRARLQVLLDSLTTPEEAATESALRRERLEAELAAAATQLALAESVSSSESRLLSTAMTACRRTIEHPATLVLLAWVWAAVLQALAVTERNMLGTAVIDNAMASRDALKKTASNIDANG